MNYCSNCGFKIKENSNFCNNCGKNFKKNENQLQNTKNNIIDETVNIFVESKAIKKALIMLNKLLIKLTKILFFLIPIITILYIINRPSDFHIYLMAMAIYLIINSALFYFFLYLKKRFIKE